MTPMSVDVRQCSNGAVQGGDDAIVDPLTDTRAYSRMSVPPSRWFVAHDLMQIQGDQKPMSGGGPLVLFLEYVSGESGQQKIEVRP
jgi:hypothetical protein